MATRSVSAGIPRPIPAAKRKLDALIAIGKPDPTATRTLRCRTIAKGRFHQLNYIRNLPPQRVAEDEPETLLGENIAPNASEALLAAFGSCLAVGIHANAVARRIPIQALELELEADINTTAVWGAGDLNPKTIGFDTYACGSDWRRIYPATSLMHLSSTRRCGRRLRTRCTTRSIWT